jgi:hypothetical protein
MVATRQKSKAKLRRKATQERRSAGPTQPAPGTSLREQNTTAAALQRAVARPSQAAPSAMLLLQRAYGNRAVTHLIQTKLLIGPTGDKYEREADRMSDQVMTTSRPSSHPKRAEVHSERRRSVEARRRPEARLVSRRAEGDFQANAGLAQRLVSRRASGSPLPGGVRAFMEPRFGADFSGVRVHADGEAARMSHSLQAKSFTLGQDIYFGKGRYDPASDEGKRLLAHELTHVVQQTGADQQPPEKSGAESTSHVGQSGQRSTIQRALMTYDEWQRITGKYSRDKSATLEILDRLVAAYPNKGIQAQDATLDRIVDIIRRWMRKHRIKKFFGFKVVKRANSLLQSALQEKAQMNWCKQVYKNAGCELPAGLKFEAAYRLARLFQAHKEDYASGGWMLKLASDAVEQSLDMNVLFGEYIAALKDHNFRYDSRGNPMSFYTDASSGNCRDMARGLSSIGTWAGHKIEAGDVITEPFATKAGATLISPHTGNVKLEGEKDYSARRFVFDSHTAALCGGIWYDPTVQAIYGDPKDAKAWELKRETRNQIDFVNVNDGAKFAPPNDDSIGPNNAYLEREKNTESQEFGDYWEVKRKPPVTKEPKKL